MSGVLPTPLYGIYEAKFGLSPIEGTLIFASYAIAVIPALFIFGPIGDKIGRKRILLVAVVICIIASLFLALGDGLLWLIIGRALQGIAVGAAFGNATAAIVELEPSKNRKRASTSSRNLNVYRLNRWTPSIRIYSRIFASTNFPCLFN